MQDFINKLISQVKNIFSKTTKVQKAIVIGILVVALGAIIATIILSSRRTGTLLFQKALSQEDARNVISVLEASNIKYQYRNGFITLNNMSDKAKAELELVKEGKMPTSLDGWELFDSPRIGITDVELDINKRRSLTKAITQLLTKLEFVQEATVDLAFPKKEYLTDVDAPVTASVVIKAEPFKEEILRDPKTVRGLQRLIAMGVDKLQPEFVTITDSVGLVLTDFTDEAANLKLKVAQEELKIVDRERKKIENKIRQTLGRIYTNRVETTIALELIWDEVTITNNSVMPIVLKEDDPSTPYDDSIITNKVQVSSRTVTEDWKGQQFIPQGAAGAEENVPPGYKDKTDRWQTYTKTDTQDNYELSKRYEAIKKGSYQIGKISAAVALDGRWTRVYDERGNPVITNGTSYVREYHPVSAEEIRNVTSLVQAAIGYNLKRGDQVSVTHLQFDHWDRFDAEDARIMRNNFIKKTLVIAMISLLALFILVLIVRAIQKELARRRRLREEELERKQMEMRRQAMMNVNEEPITEMNLEDAARKKLMEEVIRVSHERPEDVAQLLRTWMADDKQ
ncbi:flagellar basal-body MS-ring/collar protein FliF [Brachyspira aalborgi]|jgi:flagellar M-ring protein FliF|uniref:Flagellar basal body M-ring protein FliF n=1 Tax=Brachyspira aalborgi TaxID=29522 RepID=A0A5C8CP14_9SPIR|nr:flagellar basal-body MS-ring/collar protein FliF [Brachyspira aalborgi]CCY76802.1 flagellar MS-ring protein [Brachyspira sp. CAG:700]TXJ13362.1 flagellar basal body M-ring protein FliF [Brachyspira aalborgi]TXJ16002.1 flagellar basal body M-ring protein FliF [Brachyspira aalborgi]TXJ19503.1 flagellar basal body M-ring protein FliF [Brachyspira aalborgi]TXJ20209.1 flagellar basal body M-ring protein FliF [Brachyspira aalborgi]